MNETVYVFIYMSVCECVNVCDNFFFTSKFVHSVYSANGIEKFME